MIRTHAVNRYKIQRTEHPSEIILKRKLKIPGTAKGENSGILRTYSISLPQDRETPDRTRKFGEQNLLPDTAARTLHIMFLIKLFRHVGSSPTLLIGAGMLQIGSIMFLMNRNDHLLSFGAGPPPDLWCGYNSEQIYEWLEKIGPKGRKQYLEMVVWDLFPYMESYTILLGSVLLKECESAKRKSEVALVFPLAMMFDLVETLANGYATTQFPDRIDARVVEVSSIANQLKWVSFGVGLLMLSLLFFHNHIYPAKDRLINKNQ